MIEILDGMYETINYGDSLGIRLFHNDEYEDYPEHWHTGIEMIMPVENGYTVCAGKENYELRENDVIIINTGVLHSLKAPETGKRIILQFSASLLYSVKEMETLLALLPPIVYIPYDAKDEKLYEFVRSRMDRIVTEYDEKKTFRESLIYAQLIEMFVTLGRVVMEGLYEKNEIVSDGQATKHKEYMETVMGACNYINQHYQENITLEEVASVSGFSKFHFTRIFNSVWI